ncbi:hypothetical protein JTB14_010601 [Gonioctena quinquepunctata]|nr:hypothetical protein JTB14_010601 [Gonioctena quinquepunctata]
MQHLVLESLGMSENISEEVLDVLEAFICKVYQPATTLSKLSDQIKKTNELGETTTDKKLFCTSDEKGEFSTHGLEPR